MITSWPTKEELQARVLRLHDIKTSFAGFAAGLTVTPIIIVVSAAFNVQATPERIGLLFAYPVLALCIWFLVALLHRQAVESLDLENRLPCIPPQDTEGGEQ
jgi:hypothetical protein